MAEPYSTELRVRVVLAYEEGEESYAAVGERFGPGDVLVMDNLHAHHDPRVRPACRAHRVRLIYLPPYSPDFNPIEPAWALQKQYVRRVAPRFPFRLRQAARRARHRVTQQHCRNWFAHAGYPALHR